MSGFCEKLALTQLDMDKLYDEFCIVKGNINKMIEKRDYQNIFDNMEIINARKFYPNSKRSKYNGNRKKIIEAALKITKGMW